MENRFSRLKFMDFPVAALRLAIFSARYKWSQAMHKAPMSHILLRYALTFLG